MATRIHWTPAAIPDQTGRTALITGANSGIGLETARVLASHGARVILAGRSRARLDEATVTLRADLPQADLDTLLLDLGDLASIRAAAERVAAAGTLDLLINNAGVMNIPERRRTRDGFELTVGTNHLGHFALTAQVMPALRRSPSARVVTVSAIAAKWPSGALTDLMSEERYRPMGAYAKSKRANVVFTRELARRLAGTTIDAVVIHPGAAMTNLQQHTRGPVARALTGVMERFLMGSPEGAAWPSLYAATSPDVRSGDFIGPAARNQTSGTPKRVSLPRGADDRTEGERLWATSERLTGVPFAI
ncbi:oxidoreductase [Micromonospora sp. NPDC050417]|uniref:oxidoreductase n=1 Tax=Micromonospora sp. NPDC050417 TaxID=3364280 RepID=UPI0037955DE6